MATSIASPTPVPITSDYRNLQRRPLNRTVPRALSRRLHAERSSTASASSKAAPPDARAAPGDSSDDEELAPIKLSAEAEAILGGDVSQIGSPKRDPSTLAPHNELQPSLYEVAALPLDRVRQGSVSPGRSNGSPAPRVIKLAGAVRPTPLTAVGRDGSFMYKTHDKTAEAHMDGLAARTPATRLRRVRVSGSRSQTKSPPSTLSAGKSSDSNGKPGRSSAQPLVQIYDDHEEERRGSEADHVMAGPSTVARPRRVDEHAGHSTMRVKRVGAGTWLNGPARRGMIRRQSEEEAVAEDKRDENESPSPEVQQGRAAGEADLDDAPDDLPMQSPSPKPHRRSMNARAVSPHQPTSAISMAVAHVESGSKSLSRPGSPPQVLARRIRPTPDADGVAPSSRPASVKVEPIFKILSLPPLPSTHDQENEPPPTFKREKPSVAVLGELPHQSAGSDAKPASVALRTAATSPSPRRAPLLARSSNTPHRPAPAPPPKMSLIEAATSNAGSARSKKNIQMSVNGRLYKRLDCIGRGGSSRVFRVMAENYKIFALKRVSLEDADMAAITGYKGEIDLLRKLEMVDRVVKLYDYEINEEKQTLCVMMELGESDFNKTLNEQLKTENAKLDITFTRYYWKEMLECVQAVHAYGIVHSDLKPANFLLVRGQLKLIDFGIANAIQDNTVNVHRENQIGTPNYMSPESLVTAAPVAGQAVGVKLLKLGKPSDVWSLGCILYQMTYGQPPFAHITKQYERIMAIPNPKIEIQFPSTGIGGAVVPFGLIKTLKKCLQREQSLRPTIEELLSDTDPFLNPVAISPDMLGRMISNVVGYVRKKEDALRASGELVGPSPIPIDADMTAWPWAFYEKLRQAQEDGTAW